MYFVSRMINSRFCLALVCHCLVWASSLCAVEEAIYNEVQEAILKTLKLPMGVSGKQTLHIQLDSKGKAVTYEIWDPKLHLSLSEAEPVSVADKLNGLEQAVWQGDAVLTAGAYRPLLNPDALGQGELNYGRWKETPSTFGTGAFLGFALIKTDKGWKVDAAKRGARSSSEPIYDKVIPLATEAVKEPVSAVSEKEVEAAFNRLAHSQSPERLVLVERLLPTFASYINEDTHREFHTPSLQIEMLPLTTAQALNGDAKAVVRVVCQAHRFPKKVRSKTLKTPRPLPESNDRWWKDTGDDQKWESGPAPDDKNRGDCDYVGIRKDGEWTFTTSAYLLNPVWLEKVVLIPKEALPKPEDELKAGGDTAPRPLTGIGAGLAVKAEGVVFESLVAGGPADLSGELKVGDRIVGIGVDDPPSVWGRIEIAESAPQSVRDLQLSEVIKQIRGAPGTAVYLRIQPAGSSDPAQIKEVKIIRAEIKLR